MNDPTPTATTPERLRVVIQQPALAKYRIPVFRELASRPGIDLHVVYADDGNVPNVDAEGFRATFEPFRTWKGPGPELYWHPAQIRYASPEHADVVVLTWNTRFLSLVPALRRARRRGVGTVLWGHGESKHEKRATRALRHWVARRADATLFYTRSMANRLIEEGGPKDRTFVAPNSIDQAPVAQARDAFRADPDAAERFRADHRLTPGQTLAFVSRFDPRNRLDLLFEAVPELLKEFPGLRILVVGKGADEANLRAAVERVGIGSVVEFLGPIYEEQRLAPVLCSSDVFVYPSNMGLSVLHAFGYALPVVTGDQRNLHGPEIEAVEHERNALLFQHGSVPELTRAVRRILSDSDLRARLSAGAAETVAHEYSIRNMVDGMEASIRAAAARAGARRRK
ncbi:MAG: glycosyltransferase family 4 protein [Phycisphaerales bacterium]|nr:glycosyltransferase family 4 protein [Phycisphaerales bacterium]MCB9841268.1 glycosyltransferase family 4 protein [Phycisphaeraceae bacterium]